VFVSVYVLGTSQGAGDAKATFVVHKKISESKKPVTQLLVVSELSTVLALCDGKILALSVSQLSKQANIIQGVQNADYMAVNTKVHTHTHTLGLPGLGT
jgi:hypothetical protein